MADIGVQFSQYKWKNADLKYFLSKPNLHPDMLYLRDIHSSDLSLKLKTINKICKHFEFDYPSLLENVKLTPELELEIANKIEELLFIGHAFMDYTLISHAIAEMEPPARSWGNPFICADFRKIGPYLTFIPHDLSF